MKTMLAVVVLCLFSAVSYAQDSKSPVAVTNTSSFVTSSSCTYGYGECFIVSYRNDSDKVIKAVEFNIVFIDAMGDKHTYAHTFFEDRLAIKPGKKGHSIWSNLLYDYCRKYEVTVLKVAFEDGTVWKAPSTTN